MAGLLVAIAVMSLMMTVAMPVWRQINQREKEAELLWRAGQYTRAIELFKKRYANAYPANLDMLVQQKYLRKKYKDPITGGDFRLLSPMELQAAPGVSTRPGIGAAGGVGGGTGGVSGTGGVGTRPGTSNQPAELPQQRLPGRESSATREGPTAQIAGVASRSTAKSIKIYKNRQQYNQWIVTAEDVFLRPAQSGQPVNPGQPGMPGQGGRPGQQPGTATPRPSAGTPTTPPPSNIR